MMLQNTTTVDIVESINPIVEKLETWRDSLLHMTPNIVIALITLLIFYFLGRTLQHAINTYVAKYTNNRAATEIIALMVFLTVFTAGVMFALSLLKLDKAVAGFLAGAGIIGVALGFAFQETAANFISGTFMAFKDDFQVGDLIETNDTIGIVEKIELRATKIKTLDGYRVIIPNKNIFQNNLNNYNSFATRRIALTCGVAYDCDLDKVERITLDAINAIDGIRKTPSPQFFYKEFGASSINYELFFWVDFLSVPDSLDAQHLAIKAIKKRYDEEGITIPFPIQTIALQNNDSLTPNT